jgi:hypothetical protein
MRAVIFSLALMFGLHSATSLASQWVGCSNDDYRFDFIVNSEATSISEFSFYIRDQPQDSKNWAVQEKKINFPERKIEFVAMAPENKLKLRLITKYRKGTLQLGNRSYQVNCDWNNWE